jgi:hypothetical protein
MPNFKVQRTPVGAADPDVRDTRARYVEEVQGKKHRPVEFLQQAIDRETLAAYTQLRYPNLP